MGVRRSRGFTLIELLVVIAIIGVLIALLLPAVQAAREAARRSQCTNNLKQIGLALHNYHSTHDQFPLGTTRAFRCPTCANGSLPADAWVGWSAHGQLLPFLEQSPIYNSINFNYAPEGDGTWSDRINETVRVTNIKAFLCPSDTNAGRQNNNSYNASVGTSSNIGGEVGRSSGMFAAWSTYGMADVGDGTSQTVAFAESLVGDRRRGQRSTYRGNGIAGATGNDQGWGDSPGFADVQDDPTYILGRLQECLNMWTQFKAKTITSDNIGDERGRYWSVGITGWAMYNHVQTPNQYGMNYCRLGCNPGCHYDNSLSNPASSAHSGGVNVLMGDGSVKFIKDSIAQKAWWAIGTRAGGETVSSSDY